MGSLIALKCKQFHLPLLYVYGTNLTEDITNQNTNMNMENVILNVLH